MSTAVDKELMTALKKAMQARDKVAMSAIKMARSKLTEARTAKGAKELDDARARAVIASYVKSLRGAIEEFQSHGVSEDDDSITGLQAEIAVLDPWLPQLLGAEQTAAIVDAVIAEHGLAGPKMMGRGMGLVMKDHKGSVDAGLVKRLMQERLVG
ncbi:MAG TPA: hypothetical protein DCQ06_00380 [Myxococcales bacterium]|nr:hypothetical protein [Myxococcales bacterium]